MAITLTEQNVKHVLTLYPNGSTLKDFSVVSDSVNRAGEIKMIYEQYECSESVLDKEVWFIPALFQNENTTELGVYGNERGTMPIGKGSGTAFYCKIDDVTVEKKYNMIFTDVGGYGVTYDRVRNYSATLTINSTTKFTIRLTFIHATDINGYLLNYPDTSFRNISSNSLKLLPDNSNINSIPTTTQCVYKDNTSGQFIPKFYVYIEKSATETAYEVSKFTGYKAGFYERGTHDETPTFSNAEFELKRLTVDKSGFHNTNTTNCKFRVKAVAGVDVEKVFIGLFKVGSQGNDNYFDYGQLQYVDVKSGGTASEYIISGFTDPTKIDVPNNIWEIEFNIGALPKTDGYNEYKWTMLALVYSTSGTYYANSFISREYSVLDDLDEFYPAFTDDGFETTATLSDYHYEYAGHELTSVIEERIKARVKLTYDSNQWHNYLNTRLGLNIPNDIRYSISSINFRVYQEQAIPYSTDIYKHYFIEKFYPRNKPNITFNTDSDFTYTSGDDIGESWFECAYTFRNLFNNTITNLKTERIDTSGNIINLPPQTNQYWGGRTMWVEFEFVFNYVDRSTGFEINLTDRVTIRQKLIVKDYAGVDVFEYDEANNATINSTILLPNTQVDMVGVITEASVLDPENYKLITNIRDINTYNTSENETYDELVLPQLTNADIATQDEWYEESYPALAKSGYFKVKTSNYNVYSQRVISVIAKKEK